jgi:putative tryptophan/tyrosine transport system substrate-binding protein
MSALLLGLLLAASAHARAAIAVFQSDELPEYDIPVQAFLREIGQPAELFQFKGSKERALQLTAPLQEDPPPVVVAVGAKAAWIAMKQLPRVPIVYAMVIDPARYGVRGAFVTGVRMDVPPDMTLAQFQLFAPEVRSLGIIVSQENTSPQVAVAIEAARSAGYEVKARRVATSADVRRAFANLRTEVDGVWLLPDPVVLTPGNFRAIQSEALRARLPLLVESEGLVQAGALMCVAPDQAEVGRQAAALVREVLAGVTAGAIEPVAPAATRVVLNRGTSEALGLALDPVLLDFVDEVVREPSRR